MSSMEMTAALIGVRRALDSLLGPERAGEFTEDDLRKLWQGRYTTLQILQIASRVGLNQAGLAPALVDEIINAQGARAVQSAEAAAALEAMPSPSDMSEYWKWSRELVEQRMSYFDSFRPGGKTPALPVGLLDPVLDQVVGLFSQALEGTTAPLSDEDCRVAVVLCRLMANFFPNEHERRTAFSTFLEKFIGNISIMLHFPTTASNASTDESILCFVDGLQVPVYIQEVKLEIGTSGDPYYQGQRYYQLYLTSRSTCAPLVKRSVLPALLVELVGPNLRVSALASPEGAVVVCEPLTPYLHLFNTLSCQPRHMALVARVLRALKDSVGLIRSIYDNPQPAPSTSHSASAAAALLERDSSLRLPYRLRPGSGFRNVAALSTRGTRPLYVAKREADDRHVVVKFTYINEQALLVHQAWAAVGLAPQLLHFEPLPCGLTMLVMERLRREEGWALYYSLAPELKQQLHPIVLAKLDAAHEQVRVGECRTVHADMRQANCMVKLSEETPEVQVRFLDFDWSGLEGHALLPPFMRLRVEGFGAGQHATQEYDRRLWEHELLHGDS